jgi:hypothetical protein
MFAYREARRVARMVITKAIFEDTAPYGTLVSQSAQVTCGKNAGNVAREMNGRSFG